MTNQSREITLALRDEAQLLKDCYTRFSFQSWLFAGTIISIIVLLQVSLEAVPFAPILGWLSTVPLIILLSVGRIGLYKYSSANRHYGLSLLIEHQATIYRSPNEDETVSIGWEEAFYAWRMVQASVFEAIYVPRRKFPLRVFQWGMRIPFRGKYDRAHGSILFTRDLSVFYSPENTKGARLLPGIRMRIRRCVVRPEQKGKEI